MPVVNLHVAFTGSHIKEHNSVRKTIPLKQKVNIADIYIVKKSAYPACGLGGIWHDQLKTMATISVTYCKIDILIHILQ